MARNTHKSNCAEAQNPGCVCSGCGGALHGWQGWGKLAAGPQQMRDDKRHRLEGRMERNERGVLSRNTRNRQALVDLARLDITDHLSATDPTPPERRSVNPPGLGDPLGYASDRMRLATLARSIMTECWDEVSARIDDHVGSEHAARDVKKHLADHTWCSLLVALIRRIETIDHALQIVSDEGKRFVAQVITDSLSGLSGAFAQAVVRIVVDGVWAALAKLLEAHFPLLGQDTLRVLRMLALFACPSVEHHLEVYQHAMKPLLGDAAGLVSGETRSQMTTLFTAWWARHGPGTNG